jgi:hypothetical protein
MYQTLRELGPLTVLNRTQAVEDSMYDAAFYEYLEWRKEHDDLLNYEHQQDNNY